MYVINYVIMYIHWKQYFQSDKIRKEVTVLAKIFVTLKPTVFDSEGAMTRDAISQLKFGGDVIFVTKGKYFEVWLGEEDRGKASQAIQEMCQKLLVNPVIENYRFELQEDSKPEAKDS